MSLPKGIAFGVTPVAHVGRSAEDAIAGLYRDHATDVRRFLVLLVARRGDDADDLVAETFARALRALRAGRGPKGQPLPWLLLIARRAAIDRWRRERLLARHPFAVRRDEAARDAALDRIEFWSWLEALAAVLTERQRAAVVLRYRGDLTDEQIGEVLGLSASGVRSLLARALANLRRHPELWS